MAETKDYHGTSGGYTNHKCRCDKCKAAFAAYMAKFRERVKDNVPEHVHGTAGGYTNYSCRCVKCTSAHTRLTRERRKAKEVANTE